jgi:hypothetical protein
VGWIYSQMGLVFSPVQRTTGGATPGNNVIGGSEPHSEKTTYQAESSLRSIEICWQGFAVVFE